jgi:L-amino acid N-acyltransferase YncA
MRIRIDDMTPADWEAVHAIYRQGIETGHATFEAEVADRTRWEAGHLPQPRLVARAEGTLAGWAALSPVSQRHVYRGVAEVSIYVAASFRGQGIGKALLRALIRASEERGIWTLQAGIFPENVSSIALHRKCGFKTVGRREKIGRITYGPLAHTWRDVILMERRSKVAGID